MMAGNPSWCSMSNMRSLSQDHHNTSSTFLRNCPSILAQYHEGFDHHRSSSSSSNLSLNSTFANDDDDQEQLPHSWSQLLFCGIANEEDKLVSNHSLYTKKVENLEDQSGDHHIKRENFQTSQNHFTSIEDVGGDHEFINYNQNTCGGAPNWSRQQMIMPVSSPKSSVTSLGSNLFDFPSNKGSNGRIQMSYECNSTSTGGVSKKAKVQSSPTQPPLKRLLRRDSRRYTHCSSGIRTLGSTATVRKEKLGERITALHQIVSPFGKTDTASVLLEAIGYIRFYQGQIEALSSPYLCNTSPTMKHQPHGNQDGLKKDLKSRGLCLVPLSCTHHVGNDHGADYWAPQPGGGF